MKGIGKMDMQLVKESFTTLMEIFMKVSGIIIRQMDMGYIQTKRELDMKVFGEMTSSMEKVLKLGENLGDPKQLM